MLAQAPRNSPSEELRNSNLVRSQRKLFARHERFSLTLSVSLEWLVERVYMAAGGWWRAWGRERAKAFWVWGPLGAAIGGN